jgi:hypothetical protein
VGCGGGHDQSGCGGGSGQGGSGGGSGGGSSQDAGSFVYVGSSSQVVAGDGDNTIVGVGGGVTVSDGTGDDSIFLLNDSNGVGGLNNIGLGNGNNLVFLSGSGNFVFDGSGTDTISAGDGNDTFQMSALGGSDTIYNFNATDTLDMSQLLAGLGISSSDIIVTTQADSQFGAGAMDTLITAIGSSGTANIALMNYNGVDLPTMLNQNSFA